MMMWLFTAVGASLGIWMALAIYVFPEIRKTYQEKGTFTDRLLNLWYTMWAFHHIAVALASWFAVWLIPVNKTVAVAGGLIIFIAGVVLLPMGMIEFRSLRRSTGQDVSRLITTGIYRWSRNPQFIGWFLMLAGIAIAGRSGFALFLTVVFAAVIHWYTVRLAEPYLESIYGEEYRRYKADTPRYIGRPKQTGKRSGQVLSGG